MELPIDDLVKAGASGGIGGIGIVALLVRFLRGDVKRMELAQAKINSDLYAKVTDNSTALNRHELKMAEDFVPKEDFIQMRNHIDAQFVDQRNFFMALFRSQK